jgi:hypothetical protein
VVWTGLIWLRRGTVEASCEHCNKLSGSIKFWEILEWMSDWRLLKKGSAPRSYVFLQNVVLSSSYTALQADTTVHFGKYVHFLSRNITHFDLLLANCYVLCPSWSAVGTGAAIVLVTVHSNWRVRVRFTLRLAVYRQSARLGDSTLRHTTIKLFFQLNTCDHSPYVTSSLRRGWICRLKLTLASVVILRSESRGTHDHILLSRFLDSPVFISPRNRVAQLYPQALGSLFVASYDSQGYGGVFLLVCTDVFSAPFVM